MNETHEYNKLYLRNMITPKSVNGDKEWILETPKDIRAGAVFEAAKNIKAALTNLKRKNIKKFKMGFKSKRNNTWSITIPSSALKTFDNNHFGDKYVRIYPKSNKCPIIRTTEPINERMLQHDSLLHFDGLDYFLCLPDEKSIKPSSQKDDVIALDPGIRTFMTGYSPNGTICKLGEGASTRLLRLLLKVDKIDSLKTKVNKSCRRNLIRKRQRIINKVKNLTNEMHHKISLYLVRNFKTIIIPDFAPKQISNKRTRNISSRSVRQMLTLGHGKFKTILSAKAEEYGANLLWTNEAFTTKTCGCCGTTNDSIKAKKVWKCEECNQLHDRDGNAARNIYFTCTKRINYDTESLNCLTTLLDSTTSDIDVLTAT